MRWAAFITAVSISSAGVPAMAQTKPATGPSAAPAGTCATLMRQYDGASMDLAANFTSSLADDSAPRATMRAMEDSNALATAKIALDLMRDNRCPLPKSAPNTASYLTAALACRTDRIKATGAETPESCKRENWKPLGQ
jgi:hypothetical protein